MPLKVRNLVSCRDQKGNWIWLTRVWLGLYVAAIIVAPSYRVAWIKTFWMQKLPSGIRLHLLMYIYEEYWALSSWLILAQARLWNRSVVSRSLHIMLFTGIFSSLKSEPLALSSDVFVQYCAIRWREKCDVYRWMEFTF